MGKISIQKVNTAFGPISYELELKDVKNINLRIKKDGSVHVSASPSVPLDIIEAFLARKADFIIAAQKRFAERPANTAGQLQCTNGDIFYVLNQRLVLTVRKSSSNLAYIEGGSIILGVKDPDSFSLRQKTFARFFDSSCIQVFGGIMAEIYPIFKAQGVAYPELRIRNMKSRWGSCMPKKGIITINKKLLCAPTECIHYVILHEFCHFIHPDHSAAFHGLMTKLMPDWKERKKLLEKCAENWF